MAARLRGLECVPALASCPGTPAASPLPRQMPAPSVLSLPLLIPTGQCEVLE